MSTSSYYASHLQEDYAYEIVSPGIIVNQHIQEIMDSIYSDPDCPNPLGRIMRVLLLVPVEGINQHQYATLLGKLGLAKHGL